MFYYAFNFNQPLNNWDVSKVTDMRYDTDIRNHHHYRCRHSPMITRASVLTLSSCIPVHTISTHLSLACFLQRDVLPSQQL